VSESATAEAGNSDGGGRIAEEPMLACKAVQT
jgi:hypothetical protein